jgi:hypothetical protein
MPKYQPQFEGVLEGWTVNQLTHRWPNWQYAPDYEFDDVMQEARCLFMDLANRYEGKVDNPAWFTSLYKTAFTNLMIDLTKKNARNKAVRAPMEHTLPGDDDELVEQEYTGETDNAGFVLRSIEETPPQIRMAVHYLSTLSEMDVEGRYANKTLCLALGIDASRDLLTEVRNHLTTTT